MKLRMVAVTLAGVLGGSAAVAADRNVYIDPAADNPSLSSWPSPGTITGNILDDRPGDYFNFRRPEVESPPNIHYSRFQTLDSNGDGRLTAAELSVDPRMADGVTIADIDRDGGIDSGEFAAFDVDLYRPYAGSGLANWPPPVAAGGKLPDILDDQPGDYFLFKQPESLPGEPDKPEFSALDADNDGLLTRSELDVEPALSGRMGDVNGDGGVDLAEFSALEANAGLAGSSASPTWPPPPANASSPPPPEDLQGNYFVHKYQYPVPE